MQLVIDWGNTNVKVAVFNEDELVEHQIYGGALQMAHLETLLEAYPKVTAAIMSTVADEASWVGRFFADRMPYILLNHHTPLPFQNNYETPHTLGKDRIAAVAGAQATFPGKPALVIDAGTCITLDGISADGIYRGGIIAPGITMRMKAMHQQTQRLPLLEVEQGMPSLEGQSTAAAMQSGVLNGVMEEIKGLIVRYQGTYPGMQVVATGGDHKVLVKALKNTIFADPNLVLNGLNVILKYNR